MDFMDFSWNLKMHSKSIPDATEPAMNVHATEPDYSKD